MSFLSAQGQLTGSWQQTNVVSVPALTNVGSQTLYTSPPLPVGVYAVSFTLPLTAVPVDATAITTTIEYDNINVAVVSVPAADVVAPYNITQNLNALVESNGTGVLKFTNLVNSTLNENYSISAWSFQTVRIV